jgi:hypothetical protein
MLDSVCPVVLGWMILIPLVATIVRFWYRAVMWGIYTAQKFYAFSLSQQQAEG